MQNLNSKVLSHPSTCLDPLTFSSQRFRTFPGSPYLNIQNLYDRALNLHQSNISISHDGIRRTLTTKKKNTYKSVLKLRIASTSFIMEEASFALILKKMKNVRSVELKNQACLLLSQIENSIKVLRKFKHLNRVSFDWTKFYQLEDSFLNSLARTLSSFKRLSSLKLSIKQISEGSLKSMLDALSRGLKRSTLKNFAFQFSESFNHRREELPSPMPKLYSLIKRWPLETLRLKIKSSLIKEEDISSLSSVINLFKALQYLEIDLEDTSNIQTASAMTDLLTRLRGILGLKTLALPISPDGIEENPTIKHKLFNSVLSFISSNNRLEFLEVPIHPTSYSQCAQLVSRFDSLSKLKILNLSILNDNDLMILSELHRLKNLQELRITLKSSLDTELTGFFESLANLTNLKVFQFVAKDTLDERNLKNQDIQTLFKSMEKISQLFNIEITIMNKNSFLSIKDPEVENMINCVKNNEKLKGFTLQLPANYSNVSKRNSENFQNLLISKKKSSLKDYKIVGLFDKPRPFWT